jgi:hypothetical protein
VRGGEEPCSTGYLGGRAGWGGGGCLASSLIIGKVCDTQRLGGGAGYAGVALRHPAFGRRGRVRGCLASALIPGRDAKACGARHLGGGAGGEGALQRLAFGRRGGGFCGGGGFREA